MLKLLRNLLKMQGITFEPGLSVADITAKKNPAEAFSYKAARPCRPYVTSAKPPWMTDNAEQLGVERIRMSPELFAVLIRNYMYTRLLVH